ncbi:Hypothetical predicted protein [Podarcis lilfordi]|uniref:Uncharacterized protein n=1 Tax=Podarcis lilfordi TaxID=74358 RepID=A0AA35LF04_9SAUR|nr:Hypothetical predicted protein [Podarcis lilfordi]
MFTLSSILSAFHPLRYFVSCKNLSVFFLQGERERRNTVSRRQEWFKPGRLYVKRNHIFSVSDKDQSGDRVTAGSTPSRIKQHRIVILCGAVK